MRKDYRLRFVWIVTVTGFGLTSTAAAQSPYQMRWWRPAEPPPACQPPVPAVCQPVTPRTPVAPAPRPAPVEAAPPATKSETPAPEMIPPPTPAPLPAEPPPSSVLPPDLTAMAAGGPGIGTEAPA